MAGQTTVGEEDVLAEYFRTHDVPGELQEYKEMFGYFGEGMPQGRYDGAERRPKVRLSRLLMAVAAAAAVALTVVVAWPDGGCVAEPPSGHVPMVAAVADSTVENVADTASGNVRTVAPRKPRRRMGKYRYRPAPPKVYYAESRPAPTAAHADSMAEADRMLAAKLCEMERADEMLQRKIEEMQVEHDLEIALMEAIAEQRVEEEEEVY